ncbi:MAG: GNAT family N-acetyltransferase [Patescibacteria group bacterium]|nr:GNAT family N-acetyltransferase [Patescibacteria group bacterium]MDD4610583.1 GNAT family N-acetyltransferase [Patescibacteria group bacterium]
MKKNETTIQPAKMKDAVEIAKIITRETKKYGDILSKNETDILVNLFGYFTIKDRNKIIGICGLKIWPSRQAEIISLWVNKNYRKNGWGRELIKKCIEKGKEHGIKEFFALSTSPKFFEKIGFSCVNFSYFPAKVWTDCVKCAKNAGYPGHPKCNETPMLLIVK